MNLYDEIQALSFMLCHLYDCCCVKKINFIADEYDGEVLNESKKSYRDKFSDREMLTHNETLSLKSMC